MIKVCFTAEKREVHAGDVHLSIAAFMNRFCLKKTFVGDCLRRSAEVLLPGEGEVAGLALALELRLLRQLIHRGFLLLHDVPGPPEMAEPVSYTHLTLPTICSV